MNSPATGSVSLTLLDGGTGRELLRLGAPFRQPEWSALALLEAPHFVSAVHRGYIEAGADLVTTNSYALVPFHIGEERFAREGARLATLAGRLAREAADAAPRPVRVAGSLPPVCGSYRADLFDAGRARPVLQTLRRALEPYVDLWLSETLSLTAEMDLMHEVVSGSPKPWWVSYTLADENVLPGDARLRSGEPVAGAVLAAARSGAQAVLFNCCQPEVIGAALEASRAALAAEDRLGSVALGAYANGFAPQTVEAQANAEINTVRDDLGPEAYLQWARQWRAAGASLIGGCCGVGPEHIARLRAAL
ncbi:MAG: homocysteine S-methyltransferase family protein [Proteobacteria bacterium]|nr:homocysteine S-methyltransferase family protein [Pseudomonadota bacterium]